MVSALTFLPGLRPIFEDECQQYGNWTYPIRTDPRRDRWQSGRFDLQRDLTFANYTSCRSKIHLTQIHCRQKWEISSVCLSDLSEPKFHSRRRLQNFNFFLPIIPLFEQNINSHVSRTNIREKTRQASFRAISPLTKY